jgi:hypothetical protein
LPRLADVDLILGLQIYVRTRIVSKHNRLQVDSQDFWGFAFGQMRTDNMDVVRSRPRCDSANTVQKVNSSLWPLVRHDARKAGNLPE